MPTHLPPTIRLVAQQEEPQVFRAASTVQRPYLTYGEYLKHYEPTVFALLLDPETEDFKDEYRKARGVASERGERGLTFPGHSLPLYRDCVWSEVYRSQR